MRASVGSSSVGSHQWGQANILIYLRSADSLSGEGFTPSGKRFSRKSSRRSSESPLVLSIFFLSIVWEPPWGRIGTRV